MRLVMVGRPHPSSLRLPLAQCPRFPGLSPCPEGACVLWHDRKDRQCRRHRRCITPWSHRCMGPKSPLHNLLVELRTVCLPTRINRTLPMCKVGMSILSSFSSDNTRWCVIGSTGGQPAKNIAYLNMGSIPTFRNSLCSCKSIVAATVAPSE